MRTTLKNGVKCVVCWLVGAPILLLFLFAMNLTEGFASFRDDTKALFKEFPR